MTVAGEAGCTASRCRGSIDAEENLAETPSVAAASASEPETAKISTELASRNKRIAHSLGGAASGAITAVSVCPLDVVKTRLQVQDPTSASRSKYHGIVGTLGVMYREEGIKSFWIGLTPTLLGLLVTWSVYFPMYEEIKRRMANTGRKKDSLIVNLTAAVGAGALTNCITSPIWLVRTRLQTQAMKGMERFHSNGPNYLGVSDAFRRIVHEEGYRTLWRGFGPSLLGLGHVAVQFPMYEVLKRKFSDLEVRLKTAQSKGDVAGPVQHEPGVVVLLAAAALSKVVASSVAYPHEVLRARLQDQRYDKAARRRYSGFGDACAHIWSEEGVRGFYRGLSTNLARVVPSAAITFVSFELVSRHIERFLDNRDASSLLFSLNKPSQAVAARPDIWPQSQTQPQSQ